MKAEEYTDGLEMEKFQHIKEKSWYNHNYYIGYNDDLLLGVSDDDNTTEWWVISENDKHYLGNSYTTEGDILHKQLKQ
jgi:hypothetical protein